MSKLNGRTRPPSLADRAEPDPHQADLAAQRVAALIESHAAARREAVGLLGELWLRVKHGSPTDDLEQRIRDTGALD